MSKTYHLCLDVAGFLRNHTRDRDYRGVFTHDNGRDMTAREAREHLKYQLAIGRKVIPCSSECDAFDYQRGCMGHEIADAPTAVSSLAGTI